MSVGQISRLGYRISRVVNRKEEFLSVPKMNSNRLIGLAVILGILGLCRVGSAVVTDCPGGNCCLRDFSPGATCTANDLTFVVVGLGVLDDGCTDPTDDITINLRAVVSNTTAQTRYDVGFWIATDGDPNGDGASTGECARETLTPSSGAADSVSCTDLNLTCGSDLGGIGSPSGPFFDADLDSCGDILNEALAPDCGRVDDPTDDNDGNDCTLTDGVNDVTVMDFPDPVDFSCGDGDGNGFVDLDVCMSYANNENQVGGADKSCDGADDIGPGTNAKCQCLESFQTNVPVPDIGLSCECDAPTTVKPGFPVTCRVEYDNTAACTVDPNTLEQFQCGTGAYFRFDVDDGIDGVGSGAFSGINQTVLTTGSVGSIAGDPDTIEWTPASATPMDGIIGPGESVEMEFVYTVAAGTCSIAATACSSDKDCPALETCDNLPPDGPITLATSTLWSVDDTFATTTATQTLSTTCLINVNATYASVTGLELKHDHGQAVVEWKTASEVGTVGFDLLRFDSDSGKYLKVNDQLLPATEHVPGGAYRLVDVAAELSGSHTYKVVEVDSAGIEHQHGPFTVEIDWDGDAATAKAMDEEYEARARKPTKRDKRRVAKARSEKQQLASPEFLSTAAEGDRIKVKVRENGLYFVSVAELAQVKDLSNAKNLIRQGRIQLSHRGQPVAWQAAADDSGILFYGESIDSQFTLDNVYWIESGDGMQMEAVSGGAPLPVLSPQDFTEDLHSEVDALLRPGLVSDPQADYWFWMLLSNGQTKSLTFEAFDVATAAGSASLTVDLFGGSESATDPDHDVLLKVNGSAIGNISWDPLGTHVDSLSFPQSLLVEGGNTLEFVSQAGRFLVDSIDLSYERNYRALNGSLALRGDANSVVSVTGFAETDISVYDISDPFALKRVESTVVDLSGDGTYRATFAPASATAEYLAIASSAIRTDAEVSGDASADLKNPANRAEYIVIAADHLMNEAQELADYRASRGLETMAISVDDVMEVFNDGISDPEAIREFLSYAHDNWSLAPAQVALAGKGSYDYRDLQGFGGNVVPAVMANSSTGILPADNLYGDMDDDGLPEIAVGRLPILSGGELTGIIEKIIAYEASDGGTWKQQVLMVSDDPDGAGDFSSDSDDLSDLLPSTTTVQETYLLNPFTKVEARQRITDGINAGAVLLNYVGHGGFDRLASEGMFRSADVSSLVNDEKLPVVAALSCNIGLFAFPGFTSLGEELVIKGAGGAAAVWGPMGLSFNFQAVEMGSHMFASLFESNEATLGSALVETLENFLAAGGSQELAQVYSLLGDPGLEMKSLASAP
jgi:hypothetical protein